MKWAYWLKSRRLKRVEMTPPVATAAEEFVRFYGPDAWTDWLRLQAHFDLGDGFAFLILLLPGSVGADICRRQLKHHLEAKGRQLVELPCEWPEDARRLPERLFAVEPADSLGGIWLGTVIPESDPEIENWRGAWRQGLASLNQQRNPLRERFGCPLVLVGAPWLQILLRETAPDLWSVRTGVVSVTPSSEPKPTTTREFGQIETEALPVMSGEAASDPDYVLEQAERLRDRPGLETARAQLLLRAGNGFYEHARFLSAEQSFREASDLFATSAANNSEIQSAWAITLNNLANTLSALGRREEALVKVQEAVRIYAQLAKVKPDAFLPNLAMSLNNLANSLSDLGRREESLAEAQEAVRVYAQLTKVRPEAFLPDLAMSLNTLSNSLSDLGRHEEALAKAQESTQIREQLAQATPDAFLPKFARSLNNLANRLSDLGRHEESLAKAQEVARIYAQLAQAKPDAFRPNLAGSLNNLAAMLNALGRREESRVKAQEAVRIYAQLAQVRPDAFLPNLAMSLNNLATMLNNLGRREEALAKAQEAVRIREQLAQARPEAFLPNLAISYGVLGRVLTGLERHVEAAACFAKGIQALTPLFQKMPGAFANLMGHLRGSYLQAIQQAKTEPDRALLAPVETVFEKLNQAPPKE
jgi:tetratricopeptide (TPR) repeat protein